MEDCDIALGNNCNEANNHFLISILLNNLILFMSL